MSLVDGLCLVCRLAGKVSFLGSSVGVSLLWSLVCFFFLETSGFCCVVVSGMVLSFSVDGSFKISFGEASMLRIFYIPWLASSEFSGLLVKRLWSMFSILTVLE